MPPSTNAAEFCAYPSRTLVIMAKAPRPGMVKTRLIESLPTPAVTSFYRCLLEDTLALAQSLKSVDVAVMCPDRDRDELVQLLGNDVQVVAQQGQGLAAGLNSVFRHFTRDGRQKIIAFNSDSPHLALSVLEEAFERLATHDVVVGPTHDGGYYLVGAKAVHPSLFDGDGLGTTTALERLLARTEALNLSTSFTERFYDIDIANDLLLLEKELRLSPAKAPRTAAWFVDWQQVLAPLHMCSGEL